MKKYWPGPGTYNLNDSPSKTGVTISSKHDHSKSYSNADSQRNITTPGPGEYCVENSAKVTTLNGGTGKHNGFQVSFTKAKR